MISLLLLTAALLVSLTASASIGSVWFGAGLLFSFALGFRRMEYGCLRITEIFSSMAKHI